MSRRKILYDVAFARWATKNVTIHEVRDWAYASQPQIPFRPSRASQAAPSSQQVRREK